MLGQLRWRTPDLTNGGLARPPDRTLKVSDRSTSTPMRKTTLIRAKPERDERSCPVKRVVYDIFPA